MSDWKHEVDNGLELWYNEEVGNIIKTEDGSFIGMVPKLVKLGPFESIEEAIGTIEKKKESLHKTLDKCIDKFNIKMFEYLRKVKDKVEEKIDEKDEE